ARASADDQKPNFSDIGDYGSAADRFRGRASLQMEVVALRHQLSVLQRSRKRPILDVEIASWARGRPSVAAGNRQLIRRMSRGNPFGGAPRIHGELLKFGIDIGKISARKYMVLACKTAVSDLGNFGKNHLKSLVSVDFFAAPTLRFQISIYF